MVVVAVAGTTTIESEDTEVSSLRPELFAPTIRADIQCLYEDDDRDDHRPQRRRYEEPLAVKVRKQMLTIAESVGDSRIPVSRL